MTIGLEVDETRLLRRGIERGSRNMLLTARRMLGRGWVNRPRMSLYVDTLPMSGL